MLTLELMQLFFREKGIAMKTVVQRVTKAQVLVDDKVIGKINGGLMALVGFVDTDGKKTYEYMIDKLINLRIFEDDQGKLNRSVLEVDGGILIVPNFTLYADCRQGRRPSFTASAKPEMASLQFKEFVELFRKSFPKLQIGEFQAYMQVELINDGPITLIIEADRDVKI
jgi:D-tyrosyl-tRNA(Tyr) deacylase